MEFNEIKKKLKKELDKERYNHTKGVMYTAGCLAMAHNESVERAMLAGLLHDCAKCLSTEDKIKKCQKYGFEISDIEYANPGLLHAKAGVVIAREKYDVEDEEVLHSIKVHTTGEPDMSKLDKIVFIADYIEPNRNLANRLDYIREIAFKDLNTCVAEITYDTLEFLKSKKGTIDPGTQETFDYYKKYREV